MSHEQTDSEMSRNCSEVVQLVPYMVVVADAKSREHLARVACSVWRCDLVKLFSVTVFREENVDFLPGLKYIRHQICRFCLFGDFRGTFQ